MPAALHRRSIGGGPNGNAGSRCVLKARCESSMFEGHIDFCGSHKAAGGWFLSGWSSAWPSDGGGPTVSARFENGEAKGRHRVFFFPRSDVGERGLGFILFIPTGKSPPTELGEFELIEIASAAGVDTLKPWPRPARLAETDLAAGLMPILDAYGGDRAAAALRRLLSPPARKPRARQPAMPARGKAPRAADRAPAPSPRKLPEGFFIPAFYLAEYTDIRSALGPGGDALSHFLAHGVAEGRHGSPFYNVHFMRAVLEKRLRQSLSLNEAINVFLDLPRDEKFVPNEWFNPALFRQRHVGRVKGKQAGDYELFALYVRDAGRRALSPNGLFDEAAYQTEHDDVRAEIADGRVGSGFEHFVIFGWREGRSLPPILPPTLPPTPRGAEQPHDRAIRDYLLAPATSPDALPWFDERFYRSIHADVNQRVRGGEFRTGLEHFIVAGFSEGRVPHPGLVRRYRAEPRPQRLEALSRLPPPSRPTIDLDDATWLVGHVLANEWHPDANELKAYLWDLVAPPRISGSFDADAYRACNPDVAADTPEAARAHWETFGIAERRIAPGSNLFAARTLDPERIFGEAQGINYIGPLSLETGMGSAARGYVAALREAGIAVAEFDVSGIIHAGRPIDLFSAKSLPYSHNLIHLNPDQVPLLVAKFGTDTLDGRLNIGFWVWELAAPRPEWRDILSGFDLILVPSDYSRTAFSAFTNTTVLAVPHVVDRDDLLAAAQSAGTDAALQTLEAARRSGRKIILAVVDSSSYAKRKGVDVFLQIADELARQEPGRYLFCLKTHARDQSAAVRLPAGSPDLLVLDEPWAWAELCKLRAMADLYLSPHRSEGFGLNVFEAVAMGVPTVVARSGGVTDVLGADYPLYIDGKPVAIDREIGPYRKDGVWFEPDFDDAVAKIRLALSPDFAVAEYRRQHSERVSRRLSRQAVGQQLADILRTHCAIGLHLAPLGKTLLSSKTQCFRIPPPPGGTQAGERRADWLDRSAVAGIAHPAFSVITPTFNTRPAWLYELYDDLLQQDHGGWEWCIYDDGSTAPETLAALRKLKEEDARILVNFGRANAGIAVATNRAVALSSAAFVLFVDHDDRVSPQLLSSYRREIERRPAIDVLYCDEDKLLPDGSYGDHYYKPDWSPEHLASTMYVLHCLCVRKSLFLQLGGYRAETSGAQDHDFALRAAASGATFHHVDRILYHWRVSEGSAAAAADAKSYTNQAGLVAVRDFLAALGLPGTVEPGLVHGTYRIRPRITDRHVTLNILTAPGAGTIDGRRQLYVEHFVKSILEFDPAPGPRLDLAIRVVVNKGNEDLVEHMTGWDRRIEIASWPGSNTDFNFAKKANWAVRSSPSERVVLLNDDMEATDAGWLTALLEMLELPGVGASGARLLYDDGAIQHAGLVMGVNGASTHLFLGAPSNQVGYNGYTHVIRNYSAVTAACMAFAKRNFERVGGFDESFPVDYNDTDFCLKLIEAGLRIVYTPFATLRHFESRSLTRHVADPVDTQKFCRRWARYIEHDPHYNRNLTRSGAYCEAR